MIEVGKKHFKRKTFEEEKVIFCALAELGI
jgi:hypothetical protein